MYQAIPSAAEKIQINETHSCLPPSTRLDDRSLWTPDSNENTNDYTFSTQKLHDIHVTRDKFADGQTHRKLLSFAVRSFYHLIIGEKCFVRYAVPTFILASVNVTLRLQRSLNRQTKKLLHNNSLTAALHLFCKHTYKYY